ncbi:MAG: hypothetical protein HOY78_13070 [Saccharothrix sp.]|nr:hypothetical protein [Saccharothrix sp.]
MRRLIIGLTAALVLVTACGPDGGTGTAAGGRTTGTAGATGTAGERPQAEAVRLDGAAEASRKAGTAKFSVVLEADDGTGKVVASSGSGELDFAGKKSKTETTLGEQATISVVIDGTTGYVRMAAEGAEQAPWLKMDLGAVFGAGGTDPSNYLTLLDGATDVREVGTETVHGKSTTHYAIVVDRAKLVEKMPEAKAFLESLGKLGDKVGVEVDTTLTPLPYEVWVDGDGLVHRITNDTKVTNDEGKEITVASTIEFTDYGAPVTITPPSDAELGGR